MASRTVVLIPSDGTNVIQTSQVFPCTFVQPSGAEVQSIPYGEQQLGISHNAPQQIPRTRTLEKLLNVETKTLGAIQIMIGLVHIGFGAISRLHTFGYTPLAGLGGYPFWGGLFFIASGSLCVASVKNLNPDVVKWSLGMNITSAVMASFGIILYILELIINPHELELRKSVGTGIAVLLLLFSFLEFCITVSAAHFGCQATCCNSHPDTMVFVHYSVSGSMAASAESNLPPPPEYNSVDSASKAE